MVVSCTVDSDSEYVWLPLIQTPISYKLNSTTLETFPRQNGLVTEVIGVTKQLYTMEALDDLLVNVVDETLKRVFKEAGTKVIYDYLENKCHLKREEIAEKPEVFSAGLEKLLVSGAPVIENLILMNLYRKLELKFKEKKSYEFSDYVKELRKRCGC